MLAVLEDAVATLCPNLELRATGRCVKRQVHHIERWIASNDKSWTYSFLNVCEACEIDAESLRRGIEGHR